MAMSSDVMSQITRLTKAKTVEFTRRRLCIERDRGKAVTAFDGWFIKGSASISAVERVSIAGHLACCAVEKFEG